MGCAVQDSSNNVANSLSSATSFRGAVTGKFNYGVVIKGGVGGFAVPQVGGAARLLFQQRKLISIIIDGIFIKRGTRIENIK